MGYDKDVNSLFTLYEEVKTRKVDMMDSFSIGGKNINIIRYADDTVLVGDLVEQFKAPVSTVNETS